MTLTLVPTSVTGEGDWRDPAMTALGYSAGSSGMYDYLQDLRTTKWPTMCPGPDWAYIAFFTKYAVSWFAYASLGGPRLVMQYSNDGWGPTQIDRVFAHETGHIFNAPDEYTSSSCSTGGSWGYLGCPNSNCAVSNPASVDCLMKGNTYNVCGSSVCHFGWRDANGDGVPDPIDLSPPNTYGTDVGITPGSPFYNNSDLWVRNLDDGEINDSHQNPISNIDNYIYARVGNFGGVPAEIVRTRFYLANFTGTEFVYPSDYTNLITAPDTPCPVTFSLTPGSSAITKVRLRPTQIPPSTWHPCLLVHVESIQDHPVPAGTHVWDSNNLAQKNMVIDYVSPSQTLVLAIVIQNVVAAHPFFELRRIKVPANVKIQMEFQDRRAKPEIISTLQSQSTPIIGRISSSLDTGNKLEDSLLRFLSETDVAVYIPEEQRDLVFHLAEGSSINLGEYKRPKSKIQGPKTADL